MKHNWSPIMWLLDAFGDPRGCSMIELNLFWVFSDFWLQGTKIIQNFQSSRSQMSDHGRWSLLWTPEGCSHNSHPESVTDNIVFFGCCIELCSAATVFWSEFLEGKIQKDVYLHQILNGLMYMSRLKVVPKNCGGCRYHKQGVRPNHWFYPAYRLQRGNNLRYINISKCFATSTRNHGILVGLLPHP